MKKELNSLPRYNYSLYDKNYYIFITDKGNIYKVSLTVNTTFFSNIPGTIFDLSFYPDKRDRTSSDEKVKNTILFIISEVLKSKENSIVFVCDSIDNRQMARKRLFDKWYEESSREHIKLDSEIVIEDEIVFYTSLITHINNPHKKDIIQEYALAVNDLDK